ncbi:MAG: SH3 domain-containing protein [Treponema sp.]|nr:SH3 domain-containing protein [Treponema sp.]
MRKFLIITFLIVTNIRLFALSINSTAVPWSTGLRMRTNPATSANVMASLGLWEKLTIIEIKPEAETISGNTGNWVKVKRENSQMTGWCFSYFLEEIDINNFFPVLEFRGWAHSVSGYYGSNEIYTLYNDGKRREKLVLYWNNKIIETFGDVYVSDNGRVMAFNWLDTTTIRRDSRNGTVSGNKILFVYNFANHTLVKIDEAFITQSDINSARWANGRWQGDMGDFAEGFYINRNLEWFVLNSGGTKLFYETNAGGIEVDLTSGNRVNHQLRYRLDHHLVKYIGNFILLSDDGDGYVLYNPSEKRILSSFTFHYNSGTYDERNIYYPELISRNRYLVINQDNRTFKGLAIYDLTTGREQRYNEIGLPYSHDEFDGGIHHRKYFHEDYYCIMTFLHKRYSTTRTVVIRKVNYNNEIVSEYTFNNISSKMDSYSSETFTTGTGIIEFQYDRGPAWMIIYLFNNTLLEYRFDDRNYRGTYSIYLMNKY